MNKHQNTTEPADEQQITLRGPADLADALPYLLGFRPTDSVVLVALHGEQGRFGGRLRLGIPDSPHTWPAVADQLAECIVEGSERRGARPDGVILYFCQDPGAAAGATGREVMERLRPFAQRVRTACGALDVPVREAICISGDRFWSYCCPDTRCCPPEGTERILPGTSVMAAAATYAGIRVRGSLTEMEARIDPLTGPAAAEQELALDLAGADLVPKILGGGRADVAADTLDTARTVLRRLADSPVTCGATPEAEAAADRADDALIGDDEAAAVILGLQDRETRDGAAAWMEEEEAAPALRLWRALARRCVGPYAEHAPAPLTLAGWLAWSTGDEPAARVALARALAIDPRYTFARLLHQACNEGIDPETLRTFLRKERRNETETPSGPAPTTDTTRRRLRTRRARALRPSAARTAPPADPGGGARAATGRAARRAGRRRTGTGR